MTGRVTGASFSLRLCSFRPCSVSCLSCSHLRTGNGSFGRRSKSSHRPSSAHWGQQVSTLLKKARRKHHQIYGKQPFSMKPTHAETPPAAATTAIPGDGPGDSKFLYFAYGSNLLARRLHLMNPTAKRYGIGELKDYRLDFSTPASKRWGGAPATVVPDQGESVWGAIWSLDIEDRDNLDEQESVHSGLYDVFNATVRLADGDLEQCRCYLMRIVPPKLTASESRPADRQPSLVYKTVIIKGARESGLPAEYIARLEAIQDNGSKGSNPPVTLDSLLEAAPAAR